MKARATIELSEMRDVCIVRIGTGLYEGCLLHDVCARRSHIDWHDLPYDRRLPNCPLHDAPEWTEEDAKAARNFLAAQRHWLKTIKEILSNPECHLVKDTEQATKTMEKLCQLAGVGV